MTKRTTSQPSFLRFFESNKFGLAGVYVLSMCMAVVFITVLTLDIRRDSENALYLSFRDTEMNIAGVWREGWVTRVSDQVQLEGTDRKLVGVLASSREFATCLERELRSTTPRKVQNCEGVYPDQVAAILTTKGDLPLQLGIDREVRSMESYDVYALQSASNKTQNTRLATVITNLKEIN